MAGKRVPIEKRFWSKVSMGMGCWEWRGARSRTGYGYIGSGGGSRRPSLAHRVSWELHFGPIPVQLCVCHRCDNPACVNPAHLFLGTHADNSADAARKGRMSHGPARYNAKLNDVAVAEIRRRSATGESNPSIAKDFGVGPLAIWKVLHGVTWKHTA